MIIVDVQRGGPSTGLPTKTEQSDLLLAMFGRHGESPMPIVARVLAGRLLRRRDRGCADRRHYRTPVILLSDTFLSNSSEPWKIPDVDSLPHDRAGFADAPNGDGFLPYVRDENLARPWAIPGTAGLVHRIGGLEREDGTGNISYDPENHERMTHLRAGEGRRHRGRHPAARGRRPRRRRRAADPGLGLVAGHDPGGRAAGAVGRAQGRHGAPAPSQPVPVEHRRRRHGATGRC